MSHPSICAWHGKEHQRKEGGGVGWGQMWNANEPPAEPHFTFWPPPGFWIIHPTLHFQQLLGQLNNYHNLTQLPAYEIPFHPPKSKHPFDPVGISWKCKLLGLRHLITANLQWFGPPTNDFTFFRPSSQQGLTGIVTLYKASTQGFS